MPDRTSGETVDDLDAEVLGRGFGTDADRLKVGIGQILGENRNGFGGRKSGAGGERRRRGGLRMAARIPDPGTGAAGGTGPGIGPGIGPVAPAPGGPA